MKIDIKVPDGQAGRWKVETFEISEEDAKLYNLRAAFSPGSRYIEPGTYKRLLCQNQTVMSNTPAEIQDHLHFIRLAQKSKSILINGLGLGVCLQAIIESDIPEEIWVVEISANVIQLVAPTYRKDPRVKIIHANALEYKPPVGKKFDVVWHDIWPYICSDNLKEMHTLHRKYGRRTKWQGSWCKALCKMMKERGL